MNGKIFKTLPIFLSAGLLAFVLLSSLPAHAQFFDETLEQDDLFSKDDDSFFEHRGDDLGEGPQEKDFTEGDKFVDDSLVAFIAQEDVARDSFPRAFFSAALDVLIDPSHEALLCFEAASSPA